MTKTTFYQRIFTKYLFNRSFIAIVKFVHAVDNECAVTLVIFYGYAVVFNFTLRIIIDRIKNCRASCKIAEASGFSA